MVPFLQMEMEEPISCLTSPEQRLLEERFYINGVFGTVIAVFGVIANGFLATLFLTRTIYRNSPFFFLGFVALFDTLVDATFLLLLPLEVSSVYYEESVAYQIWLKYVRHVYLFAQIVKISSVFSLIMASIERYCMTKHWTFVGFEMRTRWMVLFFLVCAAVFIKYMSEEAVVVTRENCFGFRRWAVKIQRGELGHMGWLHSLAIFLPFFTLIFLNGGIVRMLRKQNVQQLRSLIAELTLGHDLSKIRRKNLRSATRTLIVIISAYLISNLLSLILIITEYFNPDYLHVHHPDLNRLATDSAALLTVVGNAIRCPAHIFSNSEIRTQFRIMLCGEREKKEVKQLTERRRTQEKLDNPWMALMWVSANNQTSDDDRAAFMPRAFIKRHSAIAIV
uniref:G_PROTEIN_RECEP_F1_2 domain-containing protein n=1 Tax=Caenorhabditis tropicalis TaxID=1561998 RepID=A0A1I7U7S8_9PELO